MWHPSPQPRIKPVPSALEGKVPTTGLPGKSQESLFCAELLCWALNSPHNARRPICCTHFTDVETREREVRELSQHLLGSGGVRSYTRQAGSTVYPLYYDALKNSKICCILGCLVESWSVVSILRRILLKAPSKDNLWNVFTASLERDFWLFVNGGALKSTMVDG